MLSAIISDTVLFRSPTTTEADKEAVRDLAKIAEVDYEKYGMEMTSRRLIFPITRQRNWHKMTQKNSVPGIMYLQLGRYQ